MLILLDAERFDRVRGWSTGAIAVADFTVPVAIMPFILVGLALAFLSVRGLNALALGDELAMAMGVRARRMRLVGGLAATLLAGAATAGAGPIAFAGLMVPHIVRPFAGADERRVLLYTALAAPSLLLIADTAGRVVLSPAENAGRHCHDSRWYAGLHRDPAAQERIFLMRVERSAPFHARHGPFASSADESQGASIFTRCLGQA